MLTSLYKIRSAYVPLLTRFTTHSILEVYNNDEAAQTEAISGVTIHVTDFVTLSRKALEGAK
jgi:hypothetical protein